jgi:hypothetical protein
MRFALLLPAFTALALAFACAPRDAIVTQDIVVTIPWPDHEESQYVLLDRKGEKELGAGMLTADLKDGQYELRLHFDGSGDKAGNSDDTTLLVNSTTLKPVSLDYVKVADSDRFHIKAAYDDAEGVVNITEIKDNGDERLVPLRLKEHHYDNDSSLFLWRTIDFKENYVAHYRTVITGNRTQLTVTLAVKRKEQITVPAGTFDTWRVEIHAGDIHQVAWIADTPQRAIVQYDNSQLLFQLKSITDQTS